MIPLHTVIRNTGNNRFILRTIREAREWESVRNEETLARSSKSPLQFIYRARRYPINERILLTGKEYCSGCDCTGMVPYTLLIFMDDWDFTAPNKHRIAPNRDE